MQRPGFPKQSVAPHSTRHHLSRSDLGLAAITTLLCMLWFSWGHYMEVRRPQAVRSQVPAPTERMVLAAVRHCRVFLGMDGEGQLVRYDRGAQRALVEVSRSHGSAGRLVQVLSQPDGTFYFNNNSTIRTDLPEDAIKNWLYAQYWRMDVWERWLSRQKDPSRNIAAG